MSILKRLMKKIFNRTTVCIFGIVVQVGYFASLCLGLGFCYNASYLVFQALGVIVSMFIINSDINSSYKIAWIFVIMSFPIFGVMFYIFFGNNSSGRKLRRKMSPYIRAERDLLSQSSFDENVLKNEPFPFTGRLITLKQAGSRFTAEQSRFIFRAARKSSARVFGNSKLRKNSFFLNISS